MADNIDWASVDFTQAEEPPKTLAAGLDWDTVAFPTTGDTSGANPVQTEIDTAEMHIQRLGDMYNMGQRDILDGLQFSKAIANPDLYDRIEHETALSPADRLLQQEVQAYKDRHAGDLIGFVSPAIESLGFMVDSVGAGLAAGVTGAGVGLVGGPAGALAGWTYGSAGGAMAFSSAAMAGMFYRDARRKGVPHDQAAVTASAVGLLSGAVETMQVGQLANMFRVAAKDASHAAMKAAGRAALKDGGLLGIEAGIRGYFKTVGIEATEEAIQEAIAIVGERAIGLLDSDWSMTDEAGKKITWWERIFDSFIGGLQAGAVMVGGAHVAGTAVGKREPTAPPTTLNQALQYANQNMTARRNAEITHVYLQGKAGVLKKKSVRSGDIQAIKTELDKIEKDIKTDRSAIRERVAEGKQVQDSTLDELTRSRVLATINAQTADMRTRVAGKERVREDLRERLATAIRKADKSEPDIAAAENAIEHIEDLITATTADVDAHKAEIKIWETLGLNPPNELISDLKTARKTLRALQQAKRDASRRLVRAKIEEKLTGAALTKEEQARLAGDAKAVQARLNEIKLDVAHSSLQLRIAEIDAVIGDLLAELMEVEPDLRARADDLRKALRDLDAQLAMAVGNDERVARLEKRRGKIYEQESVLRARLKAVAAIDVSLITGAPITENMLAAVPKGISHLYKKYVGLRTERANLELMQELIGEKLLTESDIDELNVMLASAKAQTIVDTARQRIFKAGREMKTATKKDIREAQTLLNKFIETSGLESGDRDKLRSVVAQVQTAEHLAEAFTHVEIRIHELREAAARRDALMRIDRLLAKASPKLRKLDRVKTTAQIQPILDTYKYYIQNLKQAAADALAVQHIDMTQALDLTQDARITDAGSVMIAQDVAGFGTMTSAELNDLADTIQGVYEAGVHQRFDDHQEYLNRVEKMQGSLLTYIRGTKPYSKETAHTGWLARIQNFKRVGGNRAITTWDAIVLTLGQHSVDYGMPELYLTEPQSSEYKNVNIWTKIYWDTVTNGDKRLYDRAVSGIAKEKWDAPEYVFTKTDGTKDFFIASRNELIKLWAQMHDPTLLKGLTEGNGYTLTSSNGRSTFEVLDAILSDADKQLAENLGKFYRKYHPRVNEHYIKEYGRPMPYNPQYSGIARRDGLVFDQETDAEFFTGLFENQSLVPTSVNSRTNNRYGLKLSDPFMDGVMHVRQMEHWIAYSQPVRLLRAAMHDKSIRDEIENKFGKDYLRAVNEGFKFSVGLKQRQIADGIEWVRTLRISAGLAFTAGKFFQVFKQLAAITNFLDELTWKEFIFGLADFARNHKEANRVFNAFMDVRARNLTIELREMLEPSYTNPDALGRFVRAKSVHETLAVFITWGDRMASLPGGWAVYKASLAKGLSEHEAITAAEHAINKTQSSALPDQMTPLERNEWGKTIALFTKQPIQIINLELNHLRRLISNPTKDNLNRAARAITGFHLGNALFALAVAGETAAMRALLPIDDDDEQDTLFVDLVKAAILGPFQGAPMIGALLDAIATDIISVTYNREKRVFMPKMMPLEVLENIYKISHTITTTPLDSYTSEEFFSLIHYWNRSLALLVGTRGLPVEPTTKLVERVYKNYIEPSGSEQGVIY